jgi:hypothetical protein
MREIVTNFATDMTERHPIFLPCGALLVVLFVLHLDTRRRWQNQLKEERRKRQELER